MMPSTWEMICIALALLFLWLLAMVGLSFVGRNIGDTCHCDEAEQGRNCKICDSVKNTSKGDE